MITYCHTNVRLDGTRNEEVVLAADVIVGRKVRIGNCHLQYVHSIFLRDCAKHFDKIIVGFQRSQRHL